MTIYHSLLMALVSLPFCVLENWHGAWRSKCNCSLSAQKWKWHVYIHTLNPVESNYREGLPCIKNGSYFIMDQSNSVSPKGWYHGAPSPFNSKVNAWNTVLQH